MIASANFLQILVHFWRFWTEHFGQFSKFWSVFGPTPRLKNRA